MKSTQFGIACPGNPCPLKPETHCHMPLPQKLGLNPRLEITDPEVLGIVIEVIGTTDGQIGSYDGLTGEQRETVLFERELAALCLASCADTDTVERV